jgi:hypothetical protein
MKHPVVHCLCKHRSRSQVTFFAGRTHLSALPRPSHSQDLTIKPFGHVEVALVKSQVKKDCQRLDTAAKLGVCFDL